MAVSGLFFAVLIAGILLAGQTAHARNYERTRERRTVPYEVEVTTGMQDGAGTDANVFITVYGDKGTSQEKKLSGKWNENSFEKGKVDKFQVEMMDVGKIQKITIRHDNGGFMPGWNLDKVRIVAPGGKEYIFPCNCVIQETRDEGPIRDLFPGDDNVEPPGDCDGVFQDATHCWPFNVAESDSSPDLKGGSPAKLMDGAQVVESQMRGKVASTLQHNSWINLGDFKGRCISDPVKCPKGVTMMFWAKIEQSAVLHDPSLPKYVFSSGGGDQRSRGFSLFYMDGQFVVRVVAAQRKWKIVIENGVIHFGKWFSFAFTWTAADGLKYFINGAESGNKPQGELLAESSGEEFNDFRISKDNNNNVVEKILALKIDQFATWARPLKADEISTAYQEGGKVPLIQPPADPQACLPNPCQNGGTCEPEADNPEGYFCKCRPAFSGDKCEITDEQEPPQPTQAATTAAPTTKAPTTGGPTTGGATTNAPTTGGPTTGGPTTGGPTTGVATTKAPTTGGPTTGGPTTGGPTKGQTTTGVSKPGASTTASEGTTGKPTTNAGGSSVGPTQVPPNTVAPEPVPDMEKLRKELLQQINIFRRLHKSPDVSIKEELNQKATKWAQQLAALGVEKTDTNSKYGQLVCSHHTASALAKACAVKWYGAIKFFDWAEPKLTVKASPFTQLVWKSSTQAGVGIAKKGGAMRRGIAQGKYFIVIFLEPGQSEVQDIKQNVQPAGVPYEVEVTTGMQDGAGTDANVFIIVYGDKGQSKKKELNNFFQNNFEKGNVDKFQLQIMDVGKIQKITIGHDDTGIMPEWNLDKVRIVAPGGKEYIFRCDCLIQKGALSKDLFPEGDDVKSPVPTNTGAPEPVPDMEQLKKELLKQINIFRRLHQSSDVSIKEELNQRATKWAQQLAALGVEKTDTNSAYGQLVCSHHTASDLAKACAVKWYGAIKFFDWAEPKLTVKASPFTQLVWKSSTQAGVGIAKKGGAMRRGIAQGKYFIVIFLEPGQSDEQDIKQNVQPAGAITQPAPGATCPEGYSKVQCGNSRSCFAVRKTSVSWDDALLGCAVDNGTLASLDCKEESDLVVNLLTQSKVSEAWIGLHDSLTEGRYVWVDGSPIPFSEWLPEEPNGNEAENCIVQAKGKFGPGWADKHCSDTKAFVCEVPLPGYTFYKLTFNLTEQQAQSYQYQGQYSQSYQYNCGSYCTYCTPAVHNVNDLLRETITRYFQAKNIVVQPVVNTVRCMPNGRSVVEVTLRLGPDDNSNAIVTLQTSIKENDGELELSNGASAKLVSVEILKPGSSYCPNQCASTTCQVGCDPGCCTPAVGQYPPQVSTRPEPIYNTNTSPWQCPVACTRNVNYCPPYCSANCCNKRRSGLKLHNF